MRPSLAQLAALPLLLVCCLCRPVSAATCGNGTSLVAETNTCVSSCRGTNMTGKVYLAGVFDKRAGSADEYAWWSEHHFALALNLINNKTDRMWDGILTDTTVEAVSVDSGCDENRAARAYWSIRGWGQPLHGIIGCRCSGASMAVARVAQLEQVPQMSFSSTSPRYVRKVPQWVLSRRQEHQLCLRMLPLAHDPPTPLPQPLLL
jgi:ABC-type branched-subunit amino acid transport system substrate-binding protein